MIAYSIRSFLWSIGTILLLYRFGYTHGRVAIAIDGSHTHIIEWIVAVTASEGVPGSRGLMEEDRTVESPDRLYDNSIEDMAGGYDRVLDSRRLQDTENITRNGTYFRENIKQHVVFFLIAHDRNFTSTLCDGKYIVCNHRNGTSLQLRNDLTRTIYNYENANHGMAEFKYWLFINDLMLHTITCKNHGTSNLGDRVVVCLSRLVHFLVTRSSYAQVYASNQMKLDNLEVSNVHCGSSRFHAIHRGAVPILLPYVEFAENNRRHSEDSQGILSMVGNQCLVESSIASGIIGFNQNITAYLAFRDQDTKPLYRLKAIEKIFVPLGFSRNFFTYEEEPFHEVCSRRSSDHVLTNDRLNESYAWRGTLAYKICMRTLKPYFLNFIHTGQLVRI